jgi:hypothetical protein
VDLLDLYDKLRGQLMGLICMTQRWLHVAWPKGRRTASAGVDQCPRLMRERKREEREYEGTSAPTSLPLFSDVFAGLLARL